MRSYAPKSAVVSEDHIASVATVTTAPGGNHAVAVVPPDPYTSTRCALTDAGAVERTNRPIRTPSTCFMRSPADGGFETKKGGGAGRPRLFRCNTLFRR